jgi:hypothetical protein
VGEVAGLLASFCIDKGCTPADVDERYYPEFERVLLENGIQLHWKQEEMDL